MAQYQDNFKRGTADILILHLLSSQGEMYGYQIVQVLNEKSDGRYQLLEGTLYLILMKLEEDGSVKSRSELVGKKRTRRYYSITGKGKEKLSEMLYAYDEISKGVNMILDRE